MLGAFRALARAMRQLPPRSEASERSERATLVRARCRRLERGFFISSTSGSSSRKITPSSRKSVTNDTIVACRCTIPNSAAYARCVAVVDVGAGGHEAAARSCSNIVCDAGS